MLEDIYTIIYYTANREEPKFEAKIIENLKKKAGDIPFISVSQKPMDLGKNICVGDVGHSYLNEWRQILIGAKEATTPYIIFAESDFLYPKEYFTLVPTAGLYRYNNVWIVFHKKYGDFYRRKGESEGAQICRRDLLIEKYERHLKGQSEWWNGEIVIGKRGDNPLTGVPVEYFSGLPCLSFKTGNGLRWSTNTLKGEENLKEELPYWGNIRDLRTYYL